MLISRTEAEHGAAEASGPAAGGDLGDGVVLDFGSGIPGFPGRRRYVVERLAAELEPFCVMRSMDDDAVTFVLVPPGVVFPDYTVEIDEQHVASLGLGSAEDVTVLAIVTVGQPPTANLLGPVVVNRKTKVAAQVVQYQSRYRAAEPIIVPSGSSAPR